ncbi:hypothetical protein INT47_002912 [Mucor saturninus]|uniref:Uncharacterized protein n=1 Tax=Mucor saturninus TaxID=64648 RepID=A0A8H7QQ61_9FUNG|nr:hypothetical protein INT47_002912 [Mucor saturninus]
MSKSIIQYLRENTDQSKQNDYKAVNFNISGSNCVNVANNNSVQNVHTCNIDGKEKAAEEEDVHQEGDDNNSDAASDLTVDHHPARECMYSLNYEEAADPADISDTDISVADKAPGNEETGEWVVAGLSVTIKCKTFKKKYDEIGNRSWNFVGHSSSRP